MKNDKLKIVDTFILNNNTFVVHDTGKDSISSAEREYYKYLRGSIINFEYKDNRISAKIIEVDIPFNCRAFGRSNQKIAFKLENVNHEQRN